MSLIALDYSGLPLERYALETWGWGDMIGKGIREVGLVSRFTCPWGHLLGTRPMDGSRGREKLDLPTQNVCALRGISPIKFNRHVNPSGKVSASSGRKIRISYPTLDWLILQVVTEPRWLGKLSTPPGPNFLLVDNEKPKRRCHYLTK